LSTFFSKFALFLEYVAGFFIYGQLVGCHLGVYSWEVGGRPGKDICVVDEDGCDVRVVLSFWKICSQSSLHVNRTDFFRSWIMS